ncbi:MAG: T9SS type A sorting domain-containing protein [Flavobacteriales bacterium]|nr:T9SS type A sorting domain-containing protein [Flavobacteriales bacterium]
MRLVLALMIIGAQWAGLSASAQEHPFLAGYELTELEGRVRISWTIVGGSTCNGQDVERSLNGISFTSIYRVDGICGSVSEPVPYECVDVAPPELSELYYRVKLGLDGYSSVKSIAFDQITTSDQRFYPSPTTGAATLVLRVASGTGVTLQVWDAAGRVVLERSGLTGPSIPLDVSGQRAGAYTYRAITPGRAYTGRFVKE